MSQRSSFETLGNPKSFGTLGTTLSQVLCTFRYHQKTMESSLPYWLRIIFRSPKPNCLKYFGTRVSFFSILWCSWTGNHPSDDLARFCYILDLNVGKKPQSFYILGYLLELSRKSGNLGFSFLWNLANLNHFFPWKIHCIGENHIFQVEIWWIFSTKKALLVT
jgi:hypothetical protein